LLVVPPLPAIHTNTNNGSQWASGFFAVVGVRAVSLEAWLSPTTFTGCTILSLSLF